VKEAEEKLEQIRNTPRKARKRQMESASNEGAKD
jgi:hypothetical protein